MVEDSMRSPEGFSNMVYVWGLISLISSMVFPAIGTLLCLFALTAPTSPWSQVFSYFKKYFSQLLIEFVRSWGKILQWSLLAIIPGVFKYLYYTFVPFVVVQSRVYERGEVDALALSTQLVKRHVWKIIGLIALFHLFIPLVLTSFFDEYRIITQTPVASLFLNLLDTYLLLISTQCFLRVFQKSVGQEAPHESTHV